MSGPEARVPARPARGTRPANRRQLILDAATDLFYRNGYSAVGMGDIAEAVAIGPSALYRHFRGKQELLETVVSGALTSIDSALVAAQEQPGSDLSAELAAAALDHRSVGVLWRRDVHHLPTSSRAVLRAQSKAIGARVATVIQSRRSELDAADADLLAWCALAIAHSVSFHRLTLPARGLAELMGELTSVAATVPMPSGVAAPKEQDHRDVLTAANSRREAILSASVDLFAEQGFAGVSMEEIGAAVGIAGPSVYNHFASKTDILVAAIFRGDEWLRRDMHRAFAHATDPGDGLLRLLRSYRAFAFENPRLVQMLVSEVGHLPEPERSRARAAQVAYIAEWVHLLGQVRPEWDAVRARIRVQAVLTLVNDGALTPHLRAHPQVVAVVTGIGAGLLGLPELT